METLAEFERATLRAASGEVAYEPGYIQIYCEGAAMRQLGLSESFDRLTLFFKNLALDQPGEALPEVVEAVKAQLFRHIKNPQDCVWSRMMTPKDLQQLFLFPGGNIDHTMLIGGQTSPIGNSRTIRPHFTASAMVQPRLLRSGAYPADPSRARPATCVHNN